MWYPVTNWCAMARARSYSGSWLALLWSAFLPTISNAAAWPDLQLPDGTQAAEVSSHMIYNGTDMRGQIFTSSQTAPDIVKFYRQLWGKQSVLDEIPGWQVVGHREGDFYITVQVRPDGHGSRGDIGIIRIPAGRTKVELGAGVPRPSNTTVFNDILYPDDRTPARTLAMVNNLSVDQNVNYYREHLAAAGWKPADTHTCSYGASQCVMNYEQGARKMMVALTKNAARSEIVINLMGEGVTRHD
jgi:hypothetical protein